MENNFNEADIVFVTDRSSVLCNPFIEEFNAVKKQTKFECIFILLKNSFKLTDLAVVHEFSDRVIVVKLYLKLKKYFYCS